MIPDHWRRAALAPPTAWGEPLGTGVLRATPEDFEVEEILGFAASGASANGVQILNGWRGSWRVRSG